MKRLGIVIVAALTVLVGTIVLSIGARNCCSSAGQLVETRGAPYASTGKASGVSKAEVSGLPAERHEASSASVGQLQSISRPMQLALMESSDWRKFALGALDTPEQGGYFYAMYVANLCARNLQAISQQASITVKNAVAATSTVAPEMLRNHERFLTVCASFAVNEAEELFRSVKLTSENGRDPIVNSSRNVLNAVEKGDVESLRRAFSVLLSTGDPLVFSQDVLLTRVMASGLPKGSGNLWFNGKIYAADDGNSMSALIFASQVAACSDGVPCGLDDGLMLGCISGGDCSLDRMLYVKRKMTESGLPDSVFTEFTALRQAMSSALRSGNVDAFVK